MIEIPTENLIVAGNDIGEIKIFKFNKSALEKKSSSDQINQSLNLIKEMKIFETPVKSLVFLPSREYSSYCGEKNIYLKGSENLKLGCHLVCSSTDGQISLVDLRTFKIEKVSPNIPSQKSIKTEEAQELDEEEEINKPKASKKISHSTEQIKDEASPIAAEGELPSKKGRSLFNNEENIKGLNVGKSEDIKDENLKIASNLPVYSMVYILDRKTVLFSQGTNIYEFNKFQDFEKNKNTSVNRIEVLIRDAHSDEINLLYFIKEKHILVSCSKDNIIKLWNTKDPELTCIGVLEGANNKICSICSGFIDSVWHIASLSKDGMIIFWNMENKLKTKTINLPFSIKSIAFTGYDNIFLIMSRKCGFILFDASEEIYKEFSNIEIYNRIFGSQSSKEEPKSKADKLNLLHMRLRSKYTCGIFVGNNLNIETDNYYTIFSNKLGNLDVWTNVNNSK